MMKKLGIFMIMAVFALFTAACDDGGNGVEDTPVDQPAEDSVDMPAEEAPPDIPVEDTTPDPVDDDGPAPDPVEDTIPDTPEEELGPGSCGNGAVEDPENCDDSNVVTEFCGAGCLADCSLDTSLCGNGSDDPGEQCDDGNADSYDDCTTSCTTNDHNIGAPCKCTADCDGMDFTSGTIEGCAAATAYADANRTLACTYTFVEETYGVQIFMAEGSCTLMAMSCEGLLCGIVPVTGNVEAFTCPEPYVLVTQLRSIAGMTITTKTCQIPCEIQSDCRWNSTEDPANHEWAGTCGQYTCGDGGDAGEWICGDPRNEVE